MSAPNRYRDSIAAERALAEMLGRDQDHSSLVPITREPPVPANLADHDVRRLLAAVMKDDSFEGSVWSREGFQEVLPSALAAAGNGAELQAGRVWIRCASPNGRSEWKPVTTVRTADRLFFGCSTCGRQAFPVRTEIRNRVRFPASPCDSCHALDMIRPDLAELIRPDRKLGHAPHPSRIAANAHRRVWFKCRHNNCEELLERDVHTTVQRPSLPVCARHRNRGLNFRSPTDEECSTGQIGTAAATAVDDVRLPGQAMRRIAVGKLEDCLTATLGGTPGNRAGRHHQAYVPVAYVLLDFSSELELLSDEEWNEWDDQIARAAAGHSDPSRIAAAGLSGADDATLSYSEMRDIALHKLKDCVNVIRRSDLPTEFRTLYSWKAARG